ncbi:TIM barrel protein [Novosphingobium sp. SG707]|uniref:sugar phosphate isomerase/epimerase family protein n=1 Tax=Novosphingobium sp. SG707 TaxID=2586996 RepID=UPI0014460A93|nr:TIM barrel protein [Novosphingobium sp. SG707]NKI98733.1 sugar phosphate isomerase/epimerase [Novosphingobium sp. SG707]
MKMSRREFGFGAAVLGMGAPAFAAPRRSAARLQLGVQTYSFRDMLQTPGDMVDKMIAGCRAVGLSSVELFEPTIQPPAFSRDAPWASVAGKPTEASLYGRPPEGPKPASTEQVREQVREWRLKTPMSHFAAIGARLRAAGITVQAFNFGLKEDCTDAEVERGFAMTRALGTQIMTASTTLKMAERTVPFAARHRVILGLHGHSNLHDPNQFATPESFEKGLTMSPFYRINFDIGHFVAAGFDAPAFLEKHHEKIVSIHLKDRKTHEGPNTVFGEGDTPIRDVVRMIARHGWAIPAMLEYEYAGADSVTELRRMKDYVRAALA